MELSSKYGKIGEEMMSPDYRKDFATFLFCFDFLLLFLFFICCFCRIFSLSFFKLGVVCFFYAGKKRKQRVNIILDHFPLLLWPNVMFTEMAFFIQ